MIPPNWDTRCDHPHRSRTDAGPESYAEEVSIVRSYMAADNGVGGRNSSSTAGVYGASALLDREGKECIWWVYSWLSYAEDPQVVRVMLDMGYEYMS